LSPSSSTKIIKGYTRMATEPQGEPKSRTPQSWTYDWEASRFPTAKLEIPDSGADLTPPDTQNISEETARDLGDTVAKKIDWGN